MTHMTDNPGPDQEYVTRALSELVGAQKSGAAKVLSLALEFQHFAPGTVARADAQATALTKINQMINDVPHSSPEITAWGIASAAAALISSLAARSGTDATKLLVRFEQESHRPSSRRP